MNTKRDAAESMVEKAKEQFRNMEANSEAAKQADSKEKVAKLRLKVESFCVSNNCSWMIEFLDTASMSSHQYRFCVPGHRDIFLNMGGTYGSGQWVVEPAIASPGVTESFLSVGEALIAAEKK